MNTRMEKLGRYQIEGELGRGAMGVVYRAMDPAIGRAVAIKTIRLRDLADPTERAKLRERLFREAQSAGLLSHPNIVTVYDVGEEDEQAGRSSVKSERGGVRDPTPQAEDGEQP